jgi:hypothetical protein
MGKAYTQKNTHLQTAQSQPKSQSLQESIFYSNPRQIKKQKSSPSQKNKSYSSDIQRYTDNEKEALGGNRRLAQWRVKWLIEHSSSHQLLWCIDSFVLRNRQLLVAANRQAVK